MKKHVKNIIPSAIISFLLSFMIYIYEPIIIYTSNINDFWFDSRLMIPKIILYFFILFFCLLFIYIFIYLVSYTLKKEIIYKIVIIISFILLTFSYIQGNFFVGNLPILDGEPIKWEIYKYESLLSIDVFLIVLFTEIFAIIKLKIDKTIRVNSLVMCSICIMLLAGLVSTLIKPEFYEDKTISVSTERNFNKISENKNFLIFLVDSVDSIEFSEITDDEKIFKDFTYYPDTVSAYTFTRDSIPFIFSGIWNRNEMKFSEYSTKAFNESKLLSSLRNKEYDINMYSGEIIWNNEKLTEISNFNIYKKELDAMCFYKEFTKFILYKYLAFPLKKYSRIETMDFEKCKIKEKDSENIYDWKNPNIYIMLDDRNLESDKQNYFQFVHVEGGHVPFNNDENVNYIPISEGTYDKKLIATSKIIESYINRLKENNAYDNSVIIVMADHGYFAHGNGRQNPSLYIKGIDEHHDMYTSDLPIAYEDLTEAFQELLDDKKSDELFKNIDKNRIRKFIINEFKKENNMIEYEQRGKAWDGTATFATGVEFNR